MATMNFQAIRVGLDYSFERRKRENGRRRSLALVLRSAAIRDLPELLRLEELCFQEGRFRRGHLRWILRNPSAAAFVADTGHGLSGAIMLLFESRVCRIISVAVVPAARRQGLATNLMREAERVGLARGCAVLRLEVSTANLAAIELYRTLGYKSDGVLPRYYSWGEDAYAMSKAIAPSVLPPNREEPISIS